jgi:hypothetical protein
MYKMGPTMYFATLNFQLPLPQITVILPKTNREVTTIDKADLV